MSHQWQLSLGKSVGVGCVLFYKNIVGCLLTMFFMAVIYGPNLWFLTILSSNLLFCLLSPVFRHQCGGGHSGDGWGPWYDLRSAGGPFTSPQHLQLSEGCQQPPQHPDQPPTAPPASLPRGHTHLLRLWGWARKDWKTGHPKGKCLSSLKMCFVFFFLFIFVSMRWCLG